MLTPPPVNPGLCGNCVNAKPIVTRRGSSFLMCTLSAVDHGFPKYPPLPVLICEGFIPEN